MAGARCPGPARPARRHLPRRVPRSVTIRRPVRRRPRAPRRPARRHPPSARPPSPPVPVPAVLHRPHHGPRFPPCPRTAARPPVRLSLAAARCPGQGRAPRDPVGPAQGRAARGRAVRARAARARAARARAVRARARPGLAPPGPVAAVARVPARVPVTTPTLLSRPAWAPLRVARHPGRVSPGRAAPVRRPPVRVVPVRAAPARQARAARAGRAGPARRTWPVPAGRVPARVACRHGPPVAVLVAVPAVPAVAVPAVVPARADARVAVAVAVPARVHPVPVVVAAVAPDRVPG
jgi:hypothetical protein